MKTEILPYLLMIHTLLVLGLAIISWFIHKSVKSELTNHIFKFWLVNVLNLLLNAVTSASDHMFVSMLAIVLWPYMYYLFQDLMRVFSPNMPARTASFYWVPAVGYAVTLVLSLTTDLSLTWVSFPAIYAFGYLGLGVCWSAYKGRAKREGGIDILELMALILMVSFVVHMLDWPFVRMNEKWVMVGYSYLLFNLVGFAAIFPALGMKQAGEIREKELQKLVNEKTQQLLHQSKFSALGEMAAGMAHEINNPLSIIVGKIEVIQRKITMPSFDIASLSSEFTIVKNTAFRISKIVQGLKDFSQSDAILEYQETRIGDIISDVLILCEEKLRHNTVKIEIIGNLDFKIRSKGPQLSQVFLNLFNNSYDAIEKLDSKWIRLELHRSNRPHYLKIQFMDSGLPIAEDIKNKIMEPFFTTKDIGKGTGLGLSISKGIIEGHGGKLYLDSERPHTTFVVELPII